MSASWVQLVCSAWIAAVLLVSPALAALDCACCRVVDVAAAADSTCEHCRPAVDDCCLAPNSLPGAPCRECPDCQLRQSAAPVTPGTARVTVDVVPETALYVLEVLSDRELRLDSFQTERRDRRSQAPLPAAMVLNCRWQK